MKVELKRNKPCKYENIVNLLWQVYSLVLIPHLEIKTRLLELTCQTQSVS